MYTQEEADTKIILHALDASAQGATQLSIYSPDTDVLVLALRRYPDLCCPFSFFFFLFCPCSNIHAKMNTRNQYHKLAKLLIMCTR